MPKVLKLGGKMKTISMDSEFNEGDRVRINSRGYGTREHGKINLKSMGTVTQVFPKTRTAIVAIDDFNGERDEFFFKSLTKI